MTDKPKRGRKKGSKNKVKGEDLKFVEPTEKDIKWAKEKTEQYKNSQKQPETPFPKDWDKMGKI